VGHDVLALLLGEAERHAGRRAEVAEHAGHGFQALLRVDLEKRCSIWLSCATPRPSPAAGCA
jgi:hypothetical protein